MSNPKKLKKLRLFTGNINKPLAEEICAHLGINLGNAYVGKFPGGETCVSINSNVRGRHVFAVQPICANTDSSLSPNDALMELKLLIDAAKRASAKQITAVLPYFGYARQDRKDKPRVPISAKVVARDLESAGANNVIVLDLHSNQIQAFFDIPANHVYAINVLTQYMRKNYKNLTRKNYKNFVNTVFVTPDVGGIKMARAYAEQFNCPLAIIDKRRSGPGKTEVMNIVGDIAGKDVILIDDIIATGGSLKSAAYELRKKGARSISAIAVHPVLAGDANNNIEDSFLNEVVVTNSIPLPHACRKNKKIKVVSIAKFLAQIIKRVYKNKSVSKLFIDKRVEG